jgi:uncharacterized protein
MNSSSAREQVAALVDDRIANVNLRRHMLATEAVMRALAVRLGGDPEAWGLAGLGHDLDAEETAHDFSLHGAVAAEALTGLGVPDDVAHAVAAHNPATGTAPESQIDIALVAADQVTGLITAATLVRPDKDLGNVQVKSVRKRMREGAFARGVDRDAILRCEEVGVPLDEFLALALVAMQSIAGDLGLSGGRA